MRKIIVLFIILILFSSLVSAENITKEKKEIKDYIDVESIVDKASRILVYSHTNETKKSAFERVMEYLFPEEHAEADKTISKDDKTNNETKKSSSDFSFMSIIKKIIYMWER
jgi:competence protein ComGC